MSKICLTGGAFAARHQLTNAPYAEIITVPPPTPIHGQGQIEPLISRAMFWLESKGDAGSI